jgi:hypothetical protein
MQYETQLTILLQQVVSEQNTHLKQFAVVVTATQDLQERIKVLETRLEKQNQNIGKLCIYLIIITNAVLYILLFK